MAYWNTTPPRSRIAIILSAVGIIVVATLWVTLVIVRPLPPRTEMSDAYKKKLRDEYLGLGGSPNTAMGANYFLWIIIGVSVLAVCDSVSP